MIGSIIPIFLILGIVKNVLDYFTRNSENEPYIIQAKSKALVVLTLVALLIVSIRITTNLIFNSVEVAKLANFGVPLMLGAVAIINLFLLRLTSYKFSGMFFSSGLILTLVIGTLIAKNTIHPMNTYLN